MDGMTVRKLFVVHVWSHNQVEPLPKRMAEADGRLVLLDQTVEREYAV